uniref:Nitroreductase domain-containing protein n=1 Tax=Corethron hystrix TaxID=216773 RepID=A0A7S1B6N5_9STRA|mmetsp:Transcript_15028/g.33499  ORF Transcript_15028/g.33499 Transcript_15028/m.33499 type:complete len:194 (+) Transcript_15028:527-1108(+)
MVTRSIFPRQYTGKKIPDDNIQIMLEAAKWAPSHHLTEPWYFVVFSSEESRLQLGKFLSEQYKIESKKSGKYSEKKYQKKITNMKQSSHVIAICVRPESKAKETEEIASVSMAVQNMHLVATSFGIGSYWSSASVYDIEHKKNRSIVNSVAIKNFLGLSTESFCLGWFCVGDFDGRWPEGRRKSIDDKVMWKD